MDPTYLGHPAPVPSARQSGGLMSKKIILFVIGGVIAVAAGIALMLGSSDQSGGLQQRLSARQATTLTIIEDGQKNLSGDELKKLNSEMRIVLLGDTNKLNAALASAGMKKVSKETTAAEADKDSLTRLSDAKLNGRYDTVYSDIVTQKLESLQALVAEVHDKTTSKQLKSVLKTEHEHLTLYLNALAQ